MSDIQACLAAFAVASWANNESGRAMVNRAIDGYLANFDAGDQRAALLALKAAYLKLALDSHVAIEIEAFLDRRIACLPSRSKRGGSEIDHSPPT